MRSTKKFLGQLYPPRPIMTMVVERVAEDMAMCLLSSRYSILALAECLFSPTCVAASYPPRPMVSMVDNGERIGRQGATTESSRKSQDNVGCVRARRQVMVCGVRCEEGGLVKRLDMGDISGYGNDNSI